MQRFDQFQIPATKTPEGFIQDSPIIGRVGILQYRNPDGSIRREYRPPEEAFSTDSLATLRGKPVTIGHPGLVSSDNVSDIKPIGTVLSTGKQDGDNIRADMVIYNLDTKNRELSCGYKVDLDETPGIAPSGEKFDAIQKNIRYNHIALVKRGRAGSVARLNMDSDQLLDDTYLEDGDLTAEQRKNLSAEQFGLPDKRAYPMPDKSHAQNALARAAQELKAGNLTKEEYDKIVSKAKSILKTDEGEQKTMAKVKLQNGCEYDVPQEVAAEFDSICSQNKDAKAKIAKAATDAETEKTASKKKTDELEAERDTLKADAAKFDEKLKAIEKQHADGLNESIKQRVSLLSIADAHKVDKTDEMTDKEIKISVIKSVRGDEMDLAEKSDEYINAAFDFCKEDSTSRADSMIAQRKAANSRKLAGERDDEADTSVSARQKMIDQTKNAYKKEAK